MRAGLTTRLLLAAGVLTVVVAAAFVSLLVAMADASRAKSSVRHSQDEINTAREVRNLLIDLETGQRGFVITGQQSFLEPWDAGRQALPATLARLHDMADDPGQNGRAAQLERDANAYLNDYSVWLVDAARRGDSSVKSLAASDEGKHLMDGLRREIDTYSRTEGSLILAEEAKTDAAYRRAAFPAGGGLGVSALIMVLITAYLARGVVRPVRQTARMAHRLAAGDLEARVPETGHAEIGVLERSFNSMADSLQCNQEELTRLKDEQAALRRVATLVAHGRPSNEVFAR
jgi:CHASE3 domain sensor protein